MDENPEHRLLLRYQLQACDTGLRVVGEVAGSCEAVTRCVQLQPHLIFLDVAMPDLVELHTLPLLLEATPSAYIVVTSANSDLHLRLEARAAGADGVVAKGRNLAAIATAVQRYRDHHHS